LGKQLSFFEYLSDLFDKILEDAQKAYSPITKITDAISGLSSSYKSISSEMYEDGHLSASTYNSALEAI
jgi:hypothetical protein